MTYTKLLDSSTPSSSSNQTLDDLLESMEDARCPVNQTFMTQPWILGCRHSIDLSALIDIAARQPNLPCPLDRSFSFLEDAQQNIELAKKIKAFVDENKFDLMEKYDRSDFPEGVHSWTDFTDALDRFIKNDENSDLPAKILQRKNEVELQNNEIELQNDAWFELERQAYNRESNKNLCILWLVIITLSIALTGLINYLDPRKEYNYIDPNSSNSSDYLNTTDSFDYSNSTDS